MVRVEIFQGRARRRWSGEDKRRLVAITPLTARTVVIERKWYREPLQAQYGRPRLRSDHLYQLFAYLKNLEPRAEGAAAAEGILLYPLVGEPIDVACRIQGHLVRARTLDLTVDWTGVRAQLFSLVEAK